MSKMRLAILALVTLFLATTVFAGVNKVSAAVDIVRMKKGISVAGVRTPLSQDLVQYFAGYDFVIMTYKIDADIPRIRALNPSCTIPLYFDMQFQKSDMPMWSKLTEEMFAHDIYGYRMESNQGYGYLMNLSSKAYRNLVAQWLTTGLGYYVPSRWNGIFLDNCWLDFNYLKFYTPRERIPTVLLNRSTWRPIVISYMQFLKTTIGPKLVLVNSNSAVDARTGQANLWWDYCDGEIAEGWIKPPWKDASYWPTQQEIINELTAVQAQTRKGKIFCGSTTSQAIGGADSPYLSEFQKFIYTCHLVATSNPSTTIISWNARGGATGYTLDQTYFSLMDLNHGLPLGDMLMQGSVIKRDFQNVHVELDLATHKATISARGDNPAKLNTQITFSFSPNPANPGQSVTLSGTLKTVGGSAVYPATVTVAYSTNGGVTWIFGWNLSTNAAGQFSVSFGAPGSGTYLVRVSYAGSTSYNPSSRTQTLTVSSAKVNTQIVFSFSPNPALPGKTVTLSGTLKNVNGNPIYPAQLTVQYSTNGGVTWIFGWNLSTNAAGQFSVSFGAPGVGTYLVRVSYAGSTSYNPSSRTQTLTVS